MHGIRVNLWFDTEAEEAAHFYAGIFPDSEVGTITHYPDAGRGDPRQAGRVGADR